jgi:hypothetical protein
MRGIRRSFAATFSAVLRVVVPVERAAELSTRTPERPVSTGGCLFSQAKSVRRAGLSCHVAAGSLNIRQNRFSL